MKEQISVVVLNYNGVRFLKKCFDSIFQQDYPNVEVILVDNASSDDSVEFVTKHFPNVKIIQNKVGLGFAGGNTVGVKAASSKKVLLMSNDTWIPENLISKLNSYFDTHGFSVVAPYQGGYDGKAIPPTTSLIDPLGHHIYLPGRTRKSFYLTGVCLFCTKDLYLNTQGMDTDFFLYIEDADWFWRLQLLGYTFDYVEDAYVFHSGAGSSGGSESKKLKELIFMLRNRNTVYMLLKNYSFITLLFILPLYFLINLVELFFFLLLGKLPIVKGYITGWIYIIKNRDTIKSKRAWIQSTRVVSDITIFKSMFKGPAKLIHLFQFYIK